jgi:LasA protease
LIEPPKKYLPPDIHKTMRSESAFPEKFFPPDRKFSFRSIALSISLIFFVCTGCVPEALPEITPSPAADTKTPTFSQTELATYIPTRVPMVPGQLMEYEAQSGDLLESVAARFHSSVEEVRAANPTLERDLTTLEPGRKLRIPAYYVPFTGTPFQMLPDSEVISGPSSSSFDASAFVNALPGYLASYHEYAFQHDYSGGQVVQFVARNYSINPRLLLALMEYRTQALTRNDQDPAAQALALGPNSSIYNNLTSQLDWAAEQLNDGYYGWRDGSRTQLELRDGRIVNPDSWQNAGTIAVQNLFSKWYSQKEFDEAVGPGGFIQTYRRLFGDPFVAQMILLPGGLTQPKMQLPFEPGKIWAYTGGPHPSWGEGLPWGALDFAPPSTVSGCVYSGQWITAVAEGVIARSENATVALDLDGDGDENTGWVVIYFHVGNDERIPAGIHVLPGAHIGHPSCEGGEATGSHVHMIRKFNGEWLPAYGPLAYNLSDWVSDGGKEAYTGTLSHFTDMVLHACTCADLGSQLELAPALSATPRSSATP